MKIWVREINSYNLKMGDNGVMCRYRLSGCDNGDIIMARTSNFLMHLRFLAWFAMKIPNKPIAAMNCQVCGNVLMEKLDVTEDTKTRYSAKYRCCKCGSVCEDTQKWIVKE